MCINKTQIILLFVLSCFAVTGQQLGKREAFNVPLVKMQVKNSDESDKFKEIRIRIEGNEKYSLIGPYNDKLIQNTRRDTRKSEYVEPSRYAHCLSPFELQQLEEVIGSLVKTLDIFERDLKRRQWDRCRYLDAFLPRFLQAFYYLSCTMFISEDVLSKVAFIPDSWFDVSLRSLKSDQRINNWRKKGDYIIKMRIVVRELIFQFENWLENIKSDSSSPIICYSDKLTNTYELFVKLYFNRY